MQKEQRRYIEFSNLVMDYSDGDVQIFENVKDLATLYPLKHMTTIVAVCTAGQATLAIGGKSHSLKSHDLLHCPPNIEIERCNCSNDFLCSVLCLSDHIIQGLLHDKMGNWHRTAYTGMPDIVKLSEINQTEFSFYYALIRSKVQNLQTAPYEIIQALVRALLLELCYILEDVQGTKEETKLSQGKILFNRFLRLISGNEVKRRPISHYASQLAITPKYLTMLCLKYSDKTASEWIIQYTKEDIRFYLKNSNLSIKEISAKLGFANMSHFGSYVRKHLGVSPSEFRHGKN